MQSFQDASGSVQALPVDGVGVGLWVRAVIDQNRGREDVRLMVVMPSRLPWLAVLSAVVLALVVHGQAETALPFFFVFPVWVLMFIALQAALTFVAAWIARP